MVAKPYKAKYEAEKAAREACEEKVDRLTEALVTVVESTKQLQQQSSSSGTVRRLHSA